ncbi:DUF262 domain-containing protein [Streptomyces puniciscabiei]|uniref:DUF262 domain-containing protein n=1 Tax=Streptomyces puniciscabiei TaxID=164348 RepID=UPI00331AFD1F
MTTIANAVPIGTLLASPATSIVVPRVQRPYSWESGEIKELWEDIISFHERYPGKTINSREYFMGALVGQQLTDDDQNVIEVLDGQQRLATLTILLSVLRDKLATANAETARTIQLQNIVKFVQLGSAPEYLLTLNKVDRVFFRQEIQEFPKGAPAETRTASHTLIRKAREFFDRKFDEYLEKEGTTVVDLAHRLHSIINANLKVVFIYSTSWDDVSDVFERLNDRGKGLSTLNLLRNHVLSVTPDHQQDDVEDFWEQVYALSQSSSKVDAFLRHVWITHRGDVKKQSLFKEIKAVMATPSTEDILKDPYKFSKSLASDAELYKSAILGGTHSDPTCVRWLKAIQTLQATSLLPAALSCVDDWSTASDQAQLLRSLVTTFFRFSVISGGDSSVLESAVYKVALMVRSGATLDEAQSVLRPLLRSDEQITENFASLSIPNAKSGYQRHLLTELENHLSTPKQLKDESPEKSAADSSVLWIEHIYPQHPHAGWEQWTGHESLINRVGNLTLVHKKLNAAASNKPFTEKKKIYSASGLQLNAYLERFADWTPQALQERQTHLGTVALSVWPKF